MLPSGTPTSGTSQVAATSARWLPASAVASLVFGVLSLLLIGVFFFGVYVAGLLLVWFYAASVSCGVIGVVLGHLARARRAVPRSRSAALAMAGLMLCYGSMLLSLGFFALVVLAFWLAGPSPLMN